jgi:glucose/mannose-6-phosphate isomerase
LLAIEHQISHIEEDKLHLVYNKWPEHFEEALKIECAIEHEPAFYNSIVLCGMGGSATSSDILRDILHSCVSIPVIVKRGGDLPACVGKRSLVIVKSVSGNTQETITMAEQAVSKNAEVISISSGGKLRELAETNSLKHITIPPSSYPRASLPYLIMPTLKLLSPFLQSYIDKHVLSIPSTLANISKIIIESVPYETNIAKQIANFLYQGFAFCFASPSFSSVSIRFKNSLNENAKVHCIFESILEASHNEIVPFTFDNYHQPITRKVLLVRWPFDDQIVNERFDKLKSFLSEIRQPFMEIDVPENNLISAIISSIYILDYSSIYLAISRNVNPAPTPAIDILKRFSL